MEPRGGGVGSRGVPRMHVKHHKNMLNVTRRFLPNCDVPILCHHQAEQSVANPACLFVSHT